MSTRKLNSSGSMSSACFLVAAGSRSTSLHVSPSMRFITRSGAPDSSSPRSYIGTTFGCSSDPASHASPRRLSMFSSVRCSSRSVFTATRRSSVTWWPTWTMPMPPWPSVSWTRSELGSRRILRSASSAAFPLCGGVSEDGTSVPRGFLAIVAASDESVCIRARIVFSNSCPSVALRAPSGSLFARASGSASNSPVSCCCDAVTGGA